ncbi:MAG: recombination mediator RecR [Eubacteriales bacterium]|nr:recombination mediator RecR [Bacillota bacterium]MDP3051168.1 recombination mediator RecR [Eubacteriales bacterium]MDQ7789904.1 recombination mediator RecR [Clostridia bacterium]MDZ4042191.1 recombination mediator RecR [Eubacteriales bacterium]MDZ7609569.1 recombination mediator RecR [Eubacteriales bacterium]
MMQYTRSIRRLIEELGKLPGIGPKTAQRLAYHLVTASPEVSTNLAAAIVEAREKLRYCSECADITEDDPCNMCRDERRSVRHICVVEQPRDVVALEKAHGFSGRYHVLHGSLSPMEGIGPERLTIDRLLERVRRGGVDEVILATNASLEGEATALYLAKVLKNLGVKVSRLAFGLPVGADLEYTDGRTLARAIEGRREV